VVEVPKRRLRCGRPGGAHRIFAERLPAVAEPYAQRTARLGGTPRERHAWAELPRERHAWAERPKNGMPGRSCPRFHLPGRWNGSGGSLHEHIGLALGGKAGARLAERIGTPVSGATLLRLVRLRLVRRGAAAVPITAPRVLGIDDWAWKRGQRYGTVLVDLERRAVVDLLPDREADSFAAWLHAHPGVEVIARDHGAGYADGARRGALDAVHVADRCHLLENCSAAVLQAVKRNMPAVRAASKLACDSPTAAAMVVAPATGPAVPPPMTSAQRLQWQGFQRRVQVHAEVMRLHEQGMPVRQIVRGCTRSTHGGRC